MGSNGAEGSCATGVLGSSLQYTASWGQVPGGDGLTTNTGLGLPQGSTWSTAPPGLHSHILLCWRSGQSGRLGDVPTKSTSPSWTEATHTVNSRVN